MLGVAFVRRVSQLRTVTALTHDLTKFAGSGTQSVSSPVQWCQTASVSTPSAVQGGLHGFKFTPAAVQALLRRSGSEGETVVVPVDDVKFNCDSNELRAGSSYSRQQGQASYCATSLQQAGFWTSSNGDFL